MTYMVPAWLVILASREEMHRVWGRFDHERPGISITQLLIVAGLAAIAITAAIVWRIVGLRASRTFSSNSSAKLFRELCDAHGIKRGSRRLLRRLAEARGVTNPAMLFVEPCHFETNGLPADLKASANELGELSNRFFQ